MRWFKHFSDMHEGETVTRLLDEMGHTGLCFFILQEICTNKLQKPDNVLSEADCTFRFHQRLIRDKLRLNQTKMVRLLDICSVLGQLSYKLDGNMIEIKMPILLKLLDRDTKKARQQRATDAQLCRLDIELDKDKESDKESISSSVEVFENPKPTQSRPKAAPVTISSLEELMSLDGMARSFQDWAVIYPDMEFLKRETLKAVAWYRDNNKNMKTPKGWKAAIGSWFNRSWDSHSKRKPKSSEPFDINKLL